MTHSEITAAIDSLRKRFTLPLDPGVRGPVLLNRFFEAADLTHTALSPLSYAAVRQHLITEGFVSSPEVLGDFPDTPDPLEGFLFFSGGLGLAFVKQDDILPRQRFTAAHELGHAVLHRDRMGRFRADASIAEGANQPDDALEREANRFAAELLMPEAVVRIRADELRAEYGGCPRSVLAYRLAAELLVSQQAIQYRLRELEVGDE